MFDSVALNVVISLVFIYLLYSLLASIIQEAISVNLGIRARMLKKGIRRMLDDGTGKETLSNSFYNHPLIKYLGENKLHSKPSYMSAQNFSKVLVDLLRGKDALPGQNFGPMIEAAFADKKMQWDKSDINEDTLSYLKSLWADAQGDVEKFKLKLEQWFDDTMERATGWYKKQIQLILFLIGFSLAIIFNIDTIAITQKLSSDPKLAKQLAENATAYMETHKALGDQLKARAGDSGTLSAKNTNLLHLDSMIVVQSNKLIDSASTLIKTDIKNVNQLLGLGWTCHCSASCSKKICVSGNFHSMSILGWLITALAISLGAPFWFDLLSKLMKVRVAGKNSDENPKEENKSNKQAVAINPKG